MLTCQLVNQICQAVDWSTGLQFYITQHKTWAGVHVVPTEPPVLAEPPVSTEKAPPTLGEVEKRRVEARKLRRGGEVAGVISYLTVGSDAHTGWVLNVRRGGAGQKETLANSGRQAPRKEFLKARKLKRPQRYWLGIVVLHEIHQFQKSTEVLRCKLPSHV